MTFNFLQKHVSIKVVSILVAIILWLIALNTDNPYKEREINVSLTVLNEDTLQDRNIELVNENYRRSVNIKIWGRKEIIDKASPDDFSVALDFSKVRSASDKAIEVTGPVWDNKDIEVKLVSPTNIDVSLEAIEEETFPVIVDIVGEPKEGYKITALTKTPESKKIKDIKSLVDTADSIRTTVDVTGIDSSISVTSQCKVYNKKGEEIVLLSKGLDVEIRIDVAKEVQVAMDVRGTPDSDYVEVSKTLSSSKVLVTGPSEILSGLVVLMTEPVDISGATESVVMDVGIKLPEGIKLVDSNEILNAQVVLEKLAEKTVTLEKTDITFVNASADLQYDIEMSEPVVIILKGRQTNLDKVGITDLNPRVNVTALMEGTYDIAVDISHSSLITQVEEVKVTIRVSKPATQ